MLFLSESYKVLAKRAELRKQRLAGSQRQRESPVGIDRRAAKVPAKVPNSLKRRVRFCSHRLPVQIFFKCGKRPDAGSSKLPKHARASHSRRRQR
jgi:hypothetical protein